MRTLTELSKIQSVFTRKYKRDLRTLIRQSNDKVLTHRLLSIVEEELGHTLKSIVEDTKIQLSACDQTTADLAFIEAGLHSQVAREQFEASISGSIENIQDTINNYVAMTCVKTVDVALVILKGGGTAMLMLQNITRHILPHADISDGNRLLSVGFGLACDARRYYLGEH